MGRGFVIAAPNSGSGKTTVARGLMALFVRKGYQVQPFKCGPDYIDTKFHAAVCGRASINLDTFMATPEHVRELFDRYGADADVRVVEGMMGLFDGYDRDKGSSAEIARRELCDRLILKQQSHRPTIKQNIRTSSILLSPPPQPYRQLSRHILYKNKSLKISDL